MTKPPRTIATILGLIVMSFLVHVGSAQKRGCSDARARHALDESVTLRSWDALYRSYKTFRQCDDGAISEGYSESVARILVDHWNTLPQLNRLTKNNPRFRGFVIGHLDATLNMDDIETVKKKAKTQCPTGLRTLCDDFTKQANAALKEAASSE